MVRTAWLLVTLIVVFLTYVPQLGTPFELQDDHRIIAPLVKAQAGVVPAYVSALRDDLLQVGRFRPVNQIFDVVGPRVLGPRPLLWHLLSLVLALSVAALLFKVGDRLWSPPAGAVLALITLLAPDPGPTATWYRLGPKEAWGMLFLAAALALMVARRHEALSFVMVALAAYSKESFLLLVPALFGVRVWVEMRSDGQSAATVIRRRRVLAVAYGLLFAAGVVATTIAIRMAGERSYGGQSLTLSQLEIGPVLVRDTLRAPMLAVGFIPFLLALPWNRPRPFAVLVFLAWVGPQYALHASRGGFWDHYWLPCLLAFAAANAWAIPLLGRSRVLALVLCAVWSLNAIRVDGMAVRHHREKARVQQAAVRVAAEHLRPSDDLVVVHDPTFQSETAPSFVDFVRARGGRFRRAVLHPSGMPIPSGAAVVVHLDEKPAPARPGYARIRVSGRREYLSLRKRGWDIIPFGLDLELRRND